MKCPRCGERVRVVNTRTADYTKSRLTYERNSTKNPGEWKPNFFSVPNDHLVEWANSLVGWYTADWVVRQRKCKACGWANKSIEIMEEDVAALIREEP